MEASIIIPTYNRAEKLRTCLQALAVQTHPAEDVEVIVVVDGSTDNTLDMLETLQMPFALRVISQANCGQTWALNRGAVEASGRICVFLDDDIVVAPHFLHAHLCLHQKHRQAVGIGQITMTMSADADWFARGFARSWSDHYAELNRARRQPDWDDCYGGNMSVSRAVFLAVGGNVTDLRRGYDVELAYRLKQYGCCFVYLPEALGDQFESKGFRELARDAELSGEGSVELARRHPETRQKLFGHFADNRMSWLLIWQLFLITDLSARSMNWLQRLAGTRAETFEWFVFFYNYFFWKGVRRLTAGNTYLEQMIDLKKRGHLA